MTIKMDFGANPVDKAIDPEFVPYEEVAMAFARVDSFQVHIGLASAYIDVIYQNGSPSADKSRERVIITGTDFENFLVSSFGAEEYEAALPDEVTCTGGSATTVVVAGANWTPDAMIGYVIEMVGTNAGKKRIITDNDATTITFDTMTDANVSGDKFTVNGSALSIFHRALLRTAMAVKGYAGDLVQA